MNPLTLRHPWILIITIPAAIQEAANAAAVTVLGPGNDNTFVRAFCLASEPSKVTGYICTIRVTTRQLLALRAELGLHPGWYDGLRFYRLKNLTDEFDGSNLSGLPFPVGETLSVRDVLDISGPGGEPGLLYSSPM